jgi:hypothetical protein
MNPAFAYVYDETAALPRYAVELGRIETEASRCGIDGRIARLGVFRQPKKVIEEAVTYGAKTIVFVGTDQAVYHHLAALIELDVTIAFLPLEQNSGLGWALGIPSGSKGVELIAGRLTETIDVGLLNDKPFLTEISLPQTAAAIEVDKKYRVRPAERGSIAIRNLGSLYCGAKTIANPTDGQLEVVLQSEMPRKGIRHLFRPELLETRLFLPEGTVICKDGIHGFVDGTGGLSGTNLRFSIKPKAVRVIIGRTCQWRIAHEAR